MKQIALYHQREAAPLPLQILAEYPDNTVDLGSEDGSITISRCRVSETVEFGKCVLDKAGNAAAAKAKAEKDAAEAAAKAKAEKDAAEAAAKAKAEKDAAEAAAKAKAEKDAAEAAAKAKAEKDAAKK